MSSTPESAHLNNHHRNTLRQLFAHPVSHNVEWHAVLSLLAAIGSVERRHDGAIIVNVGSAQGHFEAPRHKDVDARTAADLRRLLSSAGYGRARDAPQGPAG